MEDGAAGSPLREAADAAEARARPGATLRPFAPFSGAAEADEGGGDWSFIDCAMEEVDLQDLPSATIACHLDPRVFVDGLCRVSPGRAGRREAGGHLLPRGGGAARGAAQRLGPVRPKAASPARAAGGAQRRPPGTQRRPRPPRRGYPSSPDWVGASAGAGARSPGSRCQSTCPDACAARPRGAPGL